MDLTRLWHPSTFICVIVVFGAIQIVPRQAASGVLEIAVVDHNGDELACRMLVRQAGGVCISPRRSVKLTILPDAVDHHFSYVFPGLCHDGPGHQYGATGGDRLAARLWRLGSCGW